MRMRRVGAIVGAFAVAFLLSCSAQQPAPRPTPETATGPIIFSGSKSGISDPFSLEAGSYRGVWSAWGVSPDEPPCTHSAELVAVDPSNADGTIALVESVEVPATGATAEVDIANLKPGDYYVEVRSACAWQIEVQRTDSR